MCSRLNLHSFLLFWTWVNFVLHLRSFCLVCARSLITASLWGLSLWCSLMQPNLPLNYFLLFCEVLALDCILWSFTPVLRTPAGGLELPPCGLKLQVAMYFGLGFFGGGSRDFFFFFFSFICFGTVFSVTRGEKQGSKFYLPLKYDLMPKFPGQLPETKVIEKLLF